MFTPNKVGQHASSSNFDAGLTEEADDRRSLLIIEDALLHSNIIAHIAAKVGFAVDRQGRMR